LKAAVVKLSYQNKASDLDKTFFYPAASQGTGDSSI